MRTRRPESNYVKLLKKAPEARLGPIVDIMGQRGDGNDLAYLFERALPIRRGFPPPSGSRLSRFWRTRP